MANANCNDLATGEDGRRVGAVSSREATMEG